MRTSHRMKKKIEDNLKIEIMYNTEAVDVIGVNTVLTGVKLRNNKTHEIYEIDAAGLFYAIGHIPNTGFLKEQQETDNAKYLITDNTKTKIYRQAITAAGSGCIAALEAERYITE